MKVYLLINYAFLYYFFAEFVKNFAKIVNYGHVVFASIKMGKLLHIRGNIVEKMCKGVLYNSLKIAGLNTFFNWEDYSPFWPVNCNKT